MQLSGGAYQSRSVIASAQRQLNLYSEPMPQVQGEPAAWALYPTPGLRLLTTLPQGPIRGLWHATNGTLYVCAGNRIYAMSILAGVWSAMPLGTITPDLTTPVSMSDNGLTMVIVDGTPSGWMVTLATNAFALIVDPTGIFRGGNWAAYLDTFFLFNVPGTPQFVSSLSLSTTFDPLYFANKESFSDLLAAIIIVKREIWLIGTATTEVWYDAGTPDFPFGQMPGVFIDRGTIAIYSPAELDNTVLWLGQDRYGLGIVMQGANYQATRVSTYAIETEFATYPTLADAIGMTFQIGGHFFYVLTFPTAGKTWALDITTKQWCELCWLDANGAEQRHRMNCAVYANAEVIVGDWQNGNLYALDLGVFTDNGAPIKRLRCFPHLLADGRRVTHHSFIADLAAGENVGS